MQNEFEKQVQQKMEELDLVPSAPVWEKIEEQIRVKKDHRKAFIWFSLLALLLTGGVYWMLQADGGHSIASKVSRQTPDQKRSVENVISIENKTNDQDQTNLSNKNEIIEKNVSDKIEKENVTTTEGGTVVEKQKDKENGIEATASSQQEHTSDFKKEKRPASIKTKNTNAAAGGTIVLDQKQRPVKQNANPGPLSNKESTKQPAEKELKLFADSVHTNPSTPDKKLSDTLARKKALNAVVIDNVDHKENLPIVDQQKKEDNVNEAITPASQTLAKTSKTKKSKWKFGVTAAAGVSGISESVNIAQIFGTSRAVMDITPQSVTSFRVPYARSYSPPTPVRNNFAFSIGAAFKKLIGKRLKLSSGIQYDYYSTLLESGRKDSQLISFNMSNGNVQVFNAGVLFADYSNQFHFISVPANLEFQLFKNLPVNLTGGLSVQQMVSTNALEYNSKTHLYYHDKGNYHKTQVFSNLGLNCTIAAGKTSWTVGPEIRYGLSKLETVSPSHHLFSAGIKAQVVFEKK